MPPCAKPRVLVVDDDASLQHMVRRLLTRAGYEVVTAEDGLAGLAAAAAGRPDLILLDYMMPRLDGHGVLRRAKADPSLAEIPVVMFSGHGTDADRKLVLELGAAAFIDKPFEVEALLETIAKCLGQR